MHPILNQNIFFIQEHVGMFKATNSYDIYNTENQQITMSCKEDNLGIITKLLRFTYLRKITPFKASIRTKTGEKVLTIKRGYSLLFSNAKVYDEQDKLVGSIHQNKFSIGGDFDIKDSNENTICHLKGKWSNMDFKFTKGTTEYAYIRKEWTSLGKVLFTTADNYTLDINLNVSNNNPLRILFLGAVICVDMMLKD